MGTIYKGYSPTYRSLGDNLDDVSQKYEFRDGLFGYKSPHGHDFTRNISSDDILSTAEDFYARLAFGGFETKHSDNMSITRMADGTVITMRKVSHSDGTPAININVENINTFGGIKKQKIHFVKEG